MIKSFLVVMLTIVSSLISALPAFSSAREVREYQCPINGFPHAFEGGRKIRSSREECEKYRTAVVDALYQANASDVRLTCTPSYDFMDTTINVLKGTFRVLVEE